MTQGTGHDHSLRAPNPTLTSLSHRACLDLFSEGHLGGSLRRRRLPFRSCRSPTPRSKDASPSAPHPTASCPSSSGRPQSPWRSTTSASTRTGSSVVLHGWSRAVAEPDEVTRLSAVDPVPWASGGRRLFIESFRTRSPDASCIVSRDDPAGGAASRDPWVLPRGLGTSSIVGWWLPTRVTPVCPPQTEPVLIRWRSNA
jgi:hypothetical protein